MILRPIFYLMWVHLFQRLLLVNIQMGWTTSWGVLVLTHVRILWDAEWITVIATSTAAVLDIIIMSNQGTCQSGALSAYVGQIILITVMMKVEHRALLVKFLKIIFLFRLLVKSASTSCIYVTVNVSALILRILIEVAMTYSYSTHWGIHEMGWLNCWFDLTETLLSLRERILLWSCKIRMLLMCKGLLSWHSYN